MLDFSNNQTTIVIALIGFATLIVNLIFTLVASARAQRAIDSSLANAGKIDTVSKQVDGLTTARVQREKDLGDANAEIARGQGRDEERIKSEAIARGVAAGVAISGVVATPTKVEVVNPVSAPAKVEVVNVPSEPTK